MKQNKFLIIVGLLMAAFVFLNAKQAIGQTQKVQIAKEIWLKQNTKSVTVSTSNEQVRSIIMKEFPGYTRANMSQKHDRLGQYWDYSFIYPNEVWSKIGSHLQQELSGKLTYHDYQMDVKQNVVIMYSHNRKVGAIPLNGQLSSLITQDNQ